MTYIKGLFSIKREQQPAFITINGYEVPNNAIAQRTVLQFFEDEIKILEDIESKEKDAALCLSKARGISRLFIESFLFRYRKEQISSLYNYYSFGDDQKTFKSNIRWRQTEDYQFDEDFDKIAELVVENQSVDIQEWYDGSFDIEREHRVIEHLYECGIILEPMTSDDPIILVQSKKELKKILKRLNGKTLLSKQDKEMLNDFFAKRKIELIKGTTEQNIEINSNPVAEELYKDLLTAFDPLSTCLSSWEVLSKGDVTNYKSPADYTIERKVHFLSCSKTVFNYVNPYKKVKEAPCIKFEEIDKIRLFFIQNM